MSPTPAPLVSVVLPAYDPGPWLAQALAGVVAQTMPRWECIVVDDGSHESLSWVTGLDPRIIVHRQDNAGVSRARNVGVQLARTELVAFLDQDDRWHPDRLQCTLDLVRDHPEAALWTSQFWWRLPDRVQPTTYPESGSLAWFLGEGGACQSAVTVRRADYLAVGGQDPDLRMCQDFDLAARLLERHGGLLAIHPRHLVTYEVHGDNASSDYWRTDHEFRAVYRARRRAARRRSDDLVVSSCRRGLRMRRRTHAFQAIDVARSSWRGRAGRETVTALGRAAVCSPGVLLREAWRRVDRWGGRT